MLGTLEPGDRLLVSELSRLGRSLSQVIQIVETLVRRKIRFIAIKEAIEFDGKQDLRTKVMIALFGLFAEVERDLISERTKEGLAAAKAKGNGSAGPRGLGNIQARRQGARHPGPVGQGCLQGLDCQDTGRLPLCPLPLHPDPQDRPKLNIRPDRPYVVFQQQSGRYPRCGAGRVGWIGTGAGGLAGPKLRLSRFSFP